MVKFGCCLFMDSKEVHERLADGLVILAQNGYDFAELNIEAIASLTETDFTEAQKIISEAALPVLAFNRFIPSTMKLTGPAVSDSELETYIVKAMRRASICGGKVIGFGSGSARSIPDGFSKEEGNQQIEKFLHLCEKYASEYELIVAIEPLNRKETNMIRWVEEAIELSARLYLPHISVLADSLHMFLERDEFDILEDAVEMNLLAHVHIAEKDRLFPGEQVDKGVDFSGFFVALQNAGYQGLISTECDYRNIEHLRSASKASLEYVKAFWLGECLDKQS